MHSLKIYTFLMISLCLAVLTGCNSDSSSESDINQPGRVAILLTDGPTDDFDEVNVVITEIKLLGDDRQVSIFQGSETVNLLTLTSHANLFAFADDVPVGSFNKIRLMVSDVSLVRYNGQGSDAIYIGENDDEIYHPKQTGNGKIDLNPQGSFDVVPGETLYIQLDMDAKKSIKIDDVGNGDYIFRPVVFVDVINHAQLGKLVRLSGIVTDLDDDRFYLCDVGMNYASHDRDDDDSDISDDDHYHQCVKVATNSETSYFSAGGMPAALADLANDQPVTVLGFFGSMDDDDHYLELEAEVVELAAGDIYQRFAGEVTSKISDSSFELLLDANQGIIATAPILVELIDGAKVYSMGGDKLTINDITQGNIAKVEGVVVLSATDPDKISAAVVFLDLKAQSHVKLSGPVSMVGSDYFCVIDVVMAERCLSVTNSTDVYQLTAEPSGIVTERVMFSSLEIAHYVDVYGYYDNGNIVADDLFIIKDPQAPSDIVVYSNDFSGNNLDDFIVGEHGSAAVMLESGQLRINPGEGYLNRGYVSLDLSAIAAEYSTILSNNSGKIVITFNASNIDGAVCGACNNQLFMKLHSHVDPSDAASFGYGLSVGGYVGDRMMLLESAHSNSKFGPIYSEVIDVLDGLSPTPSIGAFKLVYDPSNSLWELYFEQSSVAIDPLTVTTLVGSGINSGFVGENLPYLILGSQNTQSAFFDNLMVTIDQTP